ncbi:MAG: NAD(P)H-hydrate epimerase [Candidatus Omnitrophota bacterium]
MVKNSRVITAEQAQSIDSSVRDSFGISMLILMENAGRAIAEEAMDLIKPNKPLAIICGRGNNGGDGFVAARHLFT